MKRLLFLFMLTLSSLNYVKATPLFNAIAIQNTTIHTSNTDTLQADNSTSPLTQTPKKTIKYLVYYLAAGLVLLLIFFYFFLRKKSQT